MTKEFANHKLGIVYDALVKVYLKMGNSIEAIEKSYAPDEELMGMMKESDSMPMTENNYGFYLAQMKGSNATVMACVMWKNGGNPVGILSALCIKTKINLQEMEMQSAEWKANQN